MGIKRSSPATATLIPRGLEVRPADLDRWTAFGLMNRLRSQLNRVNDAMQLKDGPVVMGESDWAIFGLHNEFDPRADLYQLHYHGNLSGHWIKVLEALKGQRRYEHRDGDRVRDRVRMSRKPLNNLPAPLGYPWQLFWPARARGDGSKDGVGFNQLHRRKRRLPEPYHTQMLLWLDRQRIEDMTLLIGLRVGPDGLVKTYAKGGEK